MTLLSVFASACGLRHVDVSTALCVVVALALIIPAKPTSDNVRAASPNFCAELQEVMLASCVRHRDACTEPNFLFLITFQLLLLF